MLFLDGQNYFLASNMHLLLGSGLQSNNVWKAKKWNPIQKRVIICGFGENYIDKPSFPKWLPPSGFTSKTTGELETT